MNRQLTYFCALLLLLGACRSRAGSGATSAPSGGRADSTQIEEPPSAFSDGGEVLMPATMQRILARQDSLWARALALHYDALVVDGHVDTPTLMLDKGYQFVERHRAHESHVDLPRMFEGGLDAAFFSLYVPPYAGEGQAATARVHAMIDEVERQVALRSDSVSLARTATEVENITAAGRKAILLGLEGGHALAGSTTAMTRLYERGVRYVTVTHINSNSWADASQSAPRWNGLNEKGEEMVRAMNRVGMMIDLSHASDSTFYDALAVSEAPVILSHSSSRALTPIIRNVSDDMLRALAKNDGVVMVNFFDALVNPHLDDSVMAEVRETLPGPSLTNLWNVVYDVKRRRGLPGAALTDVVDHIDHIARVAGVDHVGLGSDFDGVFDLPAGLEDATRLPWITYELLSRGYSDADVRKILGANVLRLMRAVEAAAEKNPTANDAMGLEGALRENQ